MVLVARRRQRYGGGSAGSEVGVVSIGGKGDGGGYGNAVKVENSGSITVSGSYSRGIFAESVGGGGGDGGGALSGSFQQSVAIGGSAGKGGSGNAVIVTNNSGGTIQSSGNSSHAILAQSVGGGGGHAGYATSVTLAGQLVSASVAIGGVGGDGGGGGNVTVNNSAGVNTKGLDSHGIFAQSVGGGGGDGGFSVADTSGLIGAGYQVSVAIGGKGGSGGSAGSVTASSNTGKISSAGDHSYGILAQSVGGGGGSGGFSVASNTAIAGSLAVDVTLGGSGGSGGNGGEVSAVNASSVSTTGKNSYGILAQSVGGGGGDGGASVSGAIALANAAVVLGGSSGNGGEGGKTGLDNTGNVSTTGNNATGILAQSVGGGGGTGGLSIAAALTGNITPTISLGATGGSGGSGNEVSAVNSGQIQTTGENAQGLLVQSVGGGGGSSGFTVTGGLSAAGNFALSYGGGDVGGSGGGVAITDTGKLIVTSGERSSGILAQSVGGGGGAAWIDVTGNVQAGSVTVTLGGQKGAGGNGGAVNIQNSSDIQTEGKGAYGILAQSVGGGGGLTGYAGSGSVSNLNMTMPKGDGTNSGSGGAATVASAGVVVTKGDGAIGIFAQSIGGGGGLDATKGNSGSAGGSGSGGSVTVNINGNIATEGAYAHGIFAQSAGGTGSGAVNVTQSGIIKTEGVGSDGIIAQSSGGSGNNISVTIQGGGVQGGSGTGAAVRILEGSANLITNEGIVKSKDGIAGNAIIATTGNETIDNFGTIAGSVDLGGGDNAFNNKMNAYFYSGSTVNLGSAGTLANEGTLSPGGPENVVTSTVAGNYIQQASGVYAVDIDTRAGTADRVNLSGNAALAGLLVPIFTNKGFVSPGIRQTTIISAAGGIVNNGLKLISPTAVANYKLLYPNQTDVALSTSVNFAPSGLSRNQASTGDNINAIQLAGGTVSFATIAARLIELPTIQALAEAYDRLSPAPYLAMTTSTLFSNVRFADEMLSCGSRDGDNHFVKEGKCVWTRITDTDTPRFSGSSDNLNYEREAYSVSTGMQKQIAGNFFGGFALSYENSTTDVPHYARSTGNQIQGGLVAKARSGSTTMSLGVTGGYGWYDTKRFVNIPNPGITAASKPEIRFFSGRTRLAHAFEWQKWYLRPMLDGAISYVSQQGFDESGAGGANLKVEGCGETNVSARPALEIGGDIALFHNILLRPYIRMGMLLYVLSGSSPDVSARFEGLPADVPSFTISSDLDRYMADISAGIDLFTAGNIALRLDYSGLYSGNVNSNTVSFKFSYPF